MDENQGESVEPTETQTSNAAAQPADDGLLTGRQRAQGESTESVEGSDGSNAENDSEQHQVPDNYEYSMPEGMAVDQGLVDLMNPVFKEMELSQDQVSKLTGLYAQNIQAQVDQFNQQVESWKEASINDKEFGGDHLDENLNFANAAIDAYFTPDFLNVLKQTGLVNHPEAIRGFSKIGRTLAEDNPGGGQAPSKEMSRIEKLYG